MRSLVSGPACNVHVPLVPSSPRGLPERPPQGPRTHGKRLGVPVLAFLCRGFAAMSGRALSHEEPWHQDGLTMPSTSEPAGGDGLAGAMAAQLQRRLGQARAGGWRGCVAVRARTPKGPTPARPGRHTGLRQSSQDDQTAVAPCPWSVPRRGNCRKVCSHRDPCAPPVRVRVDPGAELGGMPYAPTSLHQLNRTF